MLNPTRTEMAVMLHEVTKILINQHIKPTSPDYFVCERARQMLLVVDTSKEIGE